MNISFSFFSFSKKLFPFLLVFLMIVSTITLSAKNETRGRTFYIQWDAPDGGDGSPDHPFNNIQDGIDTSSSGDTVYIYPGLYNDQNYLVDKSITIRGENKTTTIVTNPLDAGFLFTVTADNVTFTNIDFENSGPFAPYRKILVQGDGCLITDNIFSDFLLFSCTLGIMIDGANHTIISNNIFGIFDTSCFQMASAITINNSYDTCIENNIFSALYAISMLLKHSYNTIIRNNDIHNVVSLIYSFNTTISYNNLPGTHALAFSNSSDNYIFCNNFGRHGLKEQWKTGNQITFLDSDTLFDGNYWGRSRLLPKFIFGHNQGKLVIEIDKHPAKDFIQPTV